jgi:hypothetical protein
VPPPKQPRKSIAEALREIRRGAAERYASDLLAQVCRAVLATKKKGSLTITLKVEHDPKGDAYLLDVGFKTNLPTESYTRNYYITDTGDLSDDPPGQDGLFPHPDDEDDDVIDTAAANVRPFRKDSSA